MGSISYLRYFGEWGSFQMLPHRSLSAEMWTHNSLRATQPSPHTRRKEVPEKLRKKTVLVRVDTWDTFQKKQAAFGSDSRPPFIYISSRATESPPSRKQKKHQAVRPWAINSAPLRDTRANADTAVVRPASGGATTTAVDLSLPTVVDAPTRMSAQSGLRAGNACTCSARNRTGRDVARTIVVTMGKEKKSLPHPSVF